MGLRNRLSRDRSATAAVDRPRPDRLDPFLGDRELRSAYRALVDGDWKKLERFLLTSPKAWMFQGIATSEVLDIETVTFERWVDFKQTPRARSFYAAVQIRDAFADRSRAQAAHESEPLPADEDHRFAARLKTAEEILYEVVTDRPAMPDPWVTLLVSGRGLSVDLEELRERFENAHSRAAFRPDAALEYLESLTKKWGGSNIATLDFARWLEAEATDDSACRAALPMAHIERGLHEYGRENLARYLMQPEIVAELANGLLRFLQATESPASTEALPVLNAYALAMTADSAPTARLVIETYARIENRPTLYPWSIYGEDITDVFSEIQADQLRFANRY
ncbi:MAG: hypothetical protein AAF531_26730 [Actinomycetota bacterium]